MGLKSIKEIAKEKKADGNGDVIIKKFIVEYKLYPNGAMYPHKHYPIGSTVVKRKKKKRAKEKKCEVMNGGEL